MTATCKFSDPNNWLYIASAAYLAFASNFALGYGTKLAYGLLTLIILMSFKHRWAHHIFVLVIALVGAAYYPLAITTGAPDSSVLSAVMEADISEWLENVLAWPLDSWMIIAAAFLCILRRRKLTTRLSRIVCFYAIATMTFVPFCVHVFTTGEIDFSSAGYPPFRFVLDVLQ